MIRHPSKRSLQEWLDGDTSVPIDIDNHLETCERCASFLESISEPLPDGAIGASLQRVLDPPDTFAREIETRVIAKLDSRQVLGYFADLFGAGFETSRMLLLDGPEDEPPGPRDFDE